MTKSMRDAEQNNPSEITGGAAKKSDADNRRAKEIGGRNGPEPTRYGDWEKNGRCIDF
jgi:hypothetical protein